MQMIYIGLCRLIANTPKKTQRNHAISVSVLL